MPQPQYLTYSRKIADVWERFAAGQGLQPVRLVDLEGPRARGARSQLYRYRAYLRTAAHAGDPLANELFEICDRAIVHARCTLHSLDKCTACPGATWEVLIEPDPLIASLGASGGKP